MIHRVRGIFWSGASSRAASICGVLGALTDVCMLLFRMHIGAMSIRDMITRDEKYYE